MRTKIVFLLSVLVLAAVLSACGPTTIVAEPQPPQRTITVTGTGMVMLAPDIAYIFIGVHTENADISEAVASNNAQAQRVVDSLRNMGVDAKDIQTTNFSIWPSQQYDEDGKIIGVIYMVDNTVHVTVRDLSKLGELLDAAIGAGANNINSIQFDVADKTEALSQARRAAAESARQQAEELASAAGVELGDVQTISYYESTPTPGLFEGKGGGGFGADLAVPISSGQMTLTATVTIVFELK